MKRILGLDLGTNSIGWALVKHDYEKKTGKIEGMGSRIIPMDGKALNAFGEGIIKSQTADRTEKRLARRMIERSKLRRDRLHRVLNIIDFLPSHYKNNIDFKKHYGKFKKEVKLNYKLNDYGKHEFIFMNSYNEMIKDFNKSDKSVKIPLDWTIYYLRKKALTNKIHKNELAWILLNFNQKRGYYQQRQEEVLETNTKKTFEKLLVVDVQDTEKKTKKNKSIYKITFNNEWVVEKENILPENWINKSKEFIVSTTTLKDGSKSRKFSIVDSEKDWIAIKKNTEKQISDSGKEVGEYIYDFLVSNPTIKIRGKLIKTIERNFYKKELCAILEKQMTFHPELNNRKLLQESIDDLYPRNFIHNKSFKNKGFKDLFIDDIIFYQRKLKTKKSSKSDCNYEYKVYQKLDVKTGKKIKEKKFLKGAPKSHPFFIEFRLWQFIHNLKIYEKNEKSDIDITNNCIQNEDELCDLFDYLIVKKSVEQKHIIKFFVENNKLKKSKKKLYRWNYPEDENYTINTTYVEITNRLKKVNNFDFSNYNSSFELDLWHILYSVNDKKELKKALKTFAKRKNIDSESFYNNFINHPPYTSQYAAYSVRSLKKLLCLMRTGRHWNPQSINDEVKNRILSIIERINSLNINKYDNISSTKLNELIQSVSDDDIPSSLLKSFIKRKWNNPLSGLNTYQAAYAIYERFSEISEITRWNTPNYIDNYLYNFKQHSLRNPIVEQIVLETLRTVRDIWIEYGKGKENFFDEIHLEMVRDLKNSNQKRKKLNLINSNNERTNERIRLVLKELKDEYNDNNIRPSSSIQLEKLKIFEAGVYNNPNADFTDISKTDIDKIRRNNTPSKKEIEKYRLWLEQGYRSPYTGSIIPLSKLFTKYYQIEHIIPRSKFFDNSINNKIICESDVNDDKGNNTAYFYIKSKNRDNGNLSNVKGIPILSLAQYEKHCKTYFKNQKVKLKNLLSEEVPEGLIERQINDSRYIAKFIKSLLSNIVRNKTELEVTSKNLLPTPGAITSHLKHEWGMNNKWNELITPRFKRLNKINNTQDYGFWDSKINAFRTIIPKTGNEKVDKKRLDYRNHALDALVIACTTRNHVHYLNSLNSEKVKISLRNKLLIKNKQNDFTRHFQLPWKTFVNDSEIALKDIVVSYKKNVRVINRTNNKYEKWIKQENNLYKKVKVSQKGKNFSIRKQIHKELPAGKVKIKRIKKNEVALNKVIDNWEIIVDKKIRKKIKKLSDDYDKNRKRILYHLKNKPVSINGKEIKKVKIYEFIEGTAMRKVLSKEFTKSILDKITDSGIYKIIINHLNTYEKIDGDYDYKSGFSPEGIEQMNRNIKKLNNGKPHKPIYKVRIYEIGNKFSLGKTGNNNKKYIETAKNTNLFFAIYYNKKSNKRVFETIPLIKVIEHQKKYSNIIFSQKTPFPVDTSKGELLFHLSPEDLVYVPTIEESKNPDSFNFRKMTQSQKERIYKMEKASNKNCYFKQQYISNLICKYKVNKVNGEFGSQNKSDKTMTEDNLKIIDYCWKLKVDRLGKIVKMIY